MEAAQNALLTDERAQGLDPWYLNKVAWTLVEGEPWEYGGEVKALVYATVAVAESEYLPQQHAIVDTRARALALLGRFAEAVEEQRRAVDMCPPSHRTEYERSLEWIEQFRSRWSDDSGRLSNALIESELEATTTQLLQEEQRLAALGEL